MALFQGIPIGVYMDCNGVERVIMWWRRLKGINAIVRCFYYTTNLLSSDATRRGREVIRYCRFGCGGT